MKKYFLYELKKNRFNIIVISAVFVLIVFANILTITPSTATMAASISLTLIFVILTGLTCIVPIYVFRFKTKAKQVDVVYSLPISRLKIYLVKTFIGLLIVLIPFTVSYWLSFVFMSFFSKELFLWYYIPLYLLSLPFVVLLFGFCAFAFTRANRSKDGVLFIVLYSSVFFIAGLAIYLKSIQHGGDWWDFSYTIMLFPQFPLIFLELQFFTLIIGESAGSSLFLNYTLVSYIFLAIVGIAAYVGMFLLIKYEKPENAEQTSDSLFGFVTLIPFYLFVSSFILGIAGGISFSMIVPICIYGYISYIVFRKTPKIALQDVICLFSSIAVGALLGVIIP